jgi:hypothetical protein
MPGPTKPYYGAKIGQQVQTNYEFIEKLFDQKGQQAFRDSLFAHSTEAALRAALATLGVNVHAGVRLMVVDIQYARTKTYPPTIDPKKDDFYVLILPPVPMNKPTADPNRTDYIEDQAWEGAWHHAIVDGYGM